MAYRVAELEKLLCLSVEMMTLRWFWNGCLLPTKHSRILVIDHTQEGLEGSILNMLEEVLASDTLPA